MAYKLEQIEGIGPHFAGILANVNVKNTDQLLRHTKDDDGLKKLAERTQISLAHLEAWAHRADLMRVNGIGPEFSELLDASGVESVAELSMRNPQNLMNLLARVNAEKRLTRTVPALRTLTKWVTRAQDLVLRDKGMVRTLPSSTAGKTAVSPMAQRQPTVPRQPVVGSGAGVGQSSGGYQVSGTGSGPYRMP